ncbi:LysR substrate-binding domain-containing protein [Rhodanobacter denitrificans]|uniref:LysR family transcriptional regulator n=1 Tax=Rhodanobacter denitrificans TaxID=666685 RepID=UPI000260D997|nr:LysR family transcriptional regulator [Rhodanobacter denitrificans]EIL99744.1 LysR family transcriptional regulator [Rhodanobacter denitrificans]UJM90908.1 LysR substrate-binding domain-containing protein [Rhodanobacter denitrificans]
MDRLEAMRLYTRIVELGSFTAAADDLNLPRATVTHAIKRLEARLGAQLLQRTTRRVRATRDGETYYGHCLRLLADVDEVETDFREARVQPKGHLRIDLPASLARLLVIPALRDFFARFPQIQLDIGTGDRFVDLVREGVDCVLRVGELGDSGMVGRRVAMLEQVTVASAAYVRRHGLPDALAALRDGHLAVNWVSPTTRRVEPLEFMVGRKRREIALPGCVSVSGVDAYLGCCEAGLGIAQMPRYRIVDALKNGRLREILPAHPPPSLPMTILYPQQRQMPARLRVFVDWLVELTTA